MSANAPWVLIAVLGVAFNWFWWIDAAVRPAVTVYHDRTEVLDSDYLHRRAFAPGEDVLIRGYGRVNRVCPKEYRRVIQEPDGNRRNLPQGGGTRFDRGEGANTVIIATQEWWPAGTYEYISTGIHDCNGPFPPQIIPGFHATFDLVEGTP
jgi:hypothetical protein